MWKILFIASSIELPIYDIYLDMIDSYVLSHIDYTANYTIQSHTYVFYIYNWNEG